MALFDWTSIVILGLLWGAQVFLRSFEFAFFRVSARRLKFFTPTPNEERLENVSEDATPRLVWGFTIAFWCSVVLVFGSAFYDACMQYAAWAEDPLSKFLLPPYHGISYFWFYVGERIFAPWLIALLVALVVGALAERLNARFGDRFFETEEFPIIKIGFFLTGYPGFLFYLILVLFAELIFSALQTLIRGERAPLYFLWLPLAILAIIIRNYAVPVFILRSFNL